jgi:predicted GNAT superfamily acetyltransferase
MRFQPFTPADLFELHGLNQANVPHVGSLTTKELERVLSQTALALGLWDDVGLAGMVLAMEPSSSYPSPNFKWFVAKYERFLYVDRIAVADRARGRGLGRRLYEAVFAEAGRRGLERVTCEVNTLPPNPDSLAFHAKLGFERVGDVAHVKGEKEVTMLAAALR